MKPFVKWAGGKRQILGRIKEYIQDSNKNSNEYTYIEPFLGGGAVFFGLKPKKAIINDLNEDLMNVYKIIESSEHLKLLELLKEHEKAYKNDPDGYYYDIRAWDREENWPESKNNVERAARMIFLNKTCYNGLYRVNLKGQFNTPIGRYVNPLIADEENIKKIHEFFNNKENNITIMNTSYEKVIKKAKDGDVIYLDPPYDYEDDDGFTKYQLSGFTFEDFKKLKEECDDAIKRGAFVIISNNATTKVLKLFDDDPSYKIFYDLNKFTTLRTINSVGTNRRNGREVIIWGIPNNTPFPQANDVEKIIKLLMVDNETLQDSSILMKIIEVSTTRQVAYYLSALRYLSFINHKKELSDQILEINKDKQKIIMYIYKTLASNNIFGAAYETLQIKKDGKVTFDKKMIEKLLTDKHKISKSTIDRRMSTINKWIEWMYKVNYDNNGFDDI